MADEGIKIERLSELLAELVDYTSMHTDAITDFTEGSAIRSIYEAIAMTQEQLYQLSAENVMWAIDHGILDAFDFTPREAQHSYGMVTIDLYTPLAKETVVSAGTTFYSSVLGNKTLYFQTEQPYTIPQGTTTFKVRAYCTEGGSQGNIPANYIDSANSTQLSILSVTNEESFLTGREEEKAEELKKRFREFVATRGRATKRAIEYGVNSLEEIAGCFVQEQVGKFIVYAHDANGDLPDDLKYRIDNILEDYRPVSIPYEIRAVNKVKANLQIEIAVSDIDLATDTFTEALRLYVSDYLNHFKAGDDLVPNKLTEKILKFNSLITDVRYIGGATYTTAPEEIIRSGNIYITPISKENFNGTNELPSDGTDTPTPPNPDKPTEPIAGTKLLGFVYYNFSYNYRDSASSAAPVSVTYYDENHIIITTLPYDLSIDSSGENIKVDGTTYTVINDQGLPVKSIHYDEKGSTYTTYDDNGKILTRVTYDNFGGVDKIV